MESAWLLAVDYSYRHFAGTNRPTDRDLGRLDVPLDASPEYRARCQRIKQALDTHGSANTYYLANAHAAFHLVNSDVIGMLRFAFEGTVTTDCGDRHTEAVDLDVRLVGQTCDWLTEGAVGWFAETVRRAVAIEFDRFIHSALKPLVWFW